MHHFIFLNLNVPFFKLPSFSAAGNESAYGGERGDYVLNFKCLPKVNFYLFKLHHIIPPSRKAVHLPFASATLSSRE